MIKIRLIEKSDVSNFFELIDKNRGYLKKWLQWPDFMSSIEVAEKYIDSRINLASNNAGFCFLIISDEIIVGVIHLVDIDLANKKAMIGYWVGEEFSGMGHATNATKLILDFAHKTLNLHRIEIRCASKNIESESIPKKLGFTFEGVMRESEWLHDRYVDQHIWSLIF